MEKISEPEEVEWMRDTFDRLFTSRTGWERGVQFDLVGADENGSGPALPQILSPVWIERRLAQSQFRVNALAIARQLIGPEAKFAFDHAILKPAQNGPATPWHQDEAYNGDSQFNYEQVSVWMPLQEATLENGCMRFIPGSHRNRVLPHRSFNNDPRIHALECIGGFDAESERPCPIPAGGATIHHCRTLHSSGPNRSHIPRRAYILAFSIAPPPDHELKPYSWNVSKHTSAQDRAEAWQNRGGAIGRKSRHVAEALRKIVRRARNAVFGKPM